MYIFCLETSARFTAVVGGYTNLVSKATEYITILLVLVLYCTKYNNLDRK